MGARMTIGSARPRNDDFLVSTVPDVRASSSRCTPMPCSHISQFLIAEAGPIPMARARVLLIAVARLAAWRPTLKSWT